MVILAGIIIPDGLRTYLGVEILLFRVTSLVVSYIRLMT